MTEQAGQRPNKPSRVRQAAHHTSHTSSRTHQSKQSSASAQHNSFSRKTSSFAHKKASSGSHTGAPAHKNFTPAHKKAASSHSSAPFLRKKPHTDRAKSTSFASATPDRMKAKPSHALSRTFSQTGSHDSASTRTKAASSRARVASSEKHQQGYRPRTMKSVRAREIKRITSDTTPAYNGELDPKAGKRSAIAPGNITREKNRRERELKRATSHMEYSDGARESKHVSGDFYPNKASDARLLALRVTRLVRLRKAYTQDILNAHLDKCSLSSSDKSFAALLALGVATCYGTLDEIIDRALEKPADAFEDIRDALRISTYELIFLNKEPHAAIDQGVELVRAVSPCASGLGNAILHRIERSRASFPYGDPKRDTAALARTYGFPKWLCERLIADMGAQNAAHFMKASNAPAPLYIAINSIKSSIEEVQSAFESAGSRLCDVTVNDMSVALCKRVINPQSILHPSIKALFDEGKIFVSDACAQHIALQAALLLKGEKLLEIGCGRGSKTLLLQSHYYAAHNKQAQLDAVDLHSYKLDIVRERTKCYGVNVREFYCGNATRLSSFVPANSYDVVFVDAPCSGLGTLRRHPEIRWRLSAEAIEEIAQLELDILASAGAYVAVGGSLVYSTCTITYAENNNVVKQFLESQQGASFVLAPFGSQSCISVQLNADGADAHFAVRFKRIR